MGRNLQSKLVQGIKSITCEKRVRPEYMTVPRLKSQNRVRTYRQNPNRVQVDTKKNTQETLMLQRYFAKSPSLNRTALCRYRGQLDVQCSRGRLRSGRIEARIGLRMMPTFPRTPHHSVR